jgi:outer membrane receptor protein involved in Fe transport
MRRFRVLSAVFVLWAATAQGQTVSQTTGAIDGRVNDTSNAVLPGVTVTIASPAMMGTRDSVSSGTGTFRFVSLTPGVYSVTFELPGFATVKREAQVGAGFTATLNIEMAVAGLEEAVTVTGASPVVDTTATKISTSFEAEKLLTLPSGGNDPWSMLAATPAVTMSRIDVGGSASGTQVGYRAYGTEGQNRPYYEGINGTEGNGSNGNYVDMYAYDEVAVNTVGTNAEMGPPGVMYVFVVKSGGNTYHGEAGYYIQREKWQSFNIDDAQVAAGVEGGGGLEPRDTNRMYSFRDDFAQLGGYIMKDKLWWFGAFRDSENQIRLTNFPVKPFRTTLRVYQGKGTYQLTQNNKFIGYYQWNTKDQPNRLNRHRLNATNSIHLEDTTQFWQHYWPRISKIEFNSVLSDSMFFEIRAGQWGYNWTNTSAGGATTDLSTGFHEGPDPGPAIEDTSTGRVWGTSQRNYQNPRRNQVLGSLSYFKEGMGGSHNFKFGWEIFRQTATNGQYAGSWSDAVSVLRNGAPLEVWLLGNPQDNTEGLWNQGLYLTDTWRVNNKLTLNLGVRYDRYQNFLSAQSHEADQFFPETVEFPAADVRTWNVAAPRLGLSYNLTGDGKTVIKANWGLYWWNPGTGTGANPNGNWDRRHQWADLNRNGYWDPGEEGRLIASRGGKATVSLDPNHKDSYSVDTSVWLERELVANLGVRAGYVHREQRQLSGTFNTNQPFEAFNVPVMIADPGPDATAGNADDGPAIQAWNLDPAFLGLPTVSVVRNYPGKSKFDSVEFALTKRTSNRWSMQTSVAYTKSFDLRQPTNPNALINANAAGQDEFTDFSFKLNGTFDLPGNFKLSPVYRYQAGDNYNRTFVTRQLNYSNPTIDAQPRAEFREDNISLIDLRVDRPIMIKGKRLSPFFDLYNITNSNAEQDITVSSGANYLRPLIILPPRIVRLGVKFTW